MLRRLTSSGSLQWLEPRRSVIYREDDKAQVVPSAGSAAEMLGDDGVMALHFFQKWSIIKTMEVRL